jgi:hypothetical protein
MNKLISLPHAGANANFNIQDLEKYFLDNQLPYMIIGQRHLSFEEHPKKHSLDIWIRNHPNVKKEYKNTCQAVEKVINDIILNSKFYLDKRKCPKTNKLCKAIVYRK